MLFVPATPRSELIRTLQRADREFIKLYKTPPIRFIERVGRKLADHLSSSDLWGETACGRPGCLLCGREGGNWNIQDDQAPPLDQVVLDSRLSPATTGMELRKGRNLKCWTESVLYCLECEPCARVGTRAWYVGETSRSGFERGKEHNKDGLNTNEHSAMVKHGWDYHQLEDDQVPQFRMRVVRIFRGVLQRQVAQAIAIEMAMPDLLLNSKSEWGYPQIPHL